MKPAPAISETALITVEPDGLGIESGDPRFDRARKILEGIKMTVRMNLAGQVMLGGELLALRDALGFSGKGGHRHSKTQDASLNRTWDEWCQAELHLSHDTINRMISCFKIIQGRAKELGEDATAYRLLCAPVSTLSIVDHGILQQVVNELIKEQSQKELLQQLKIVRSPHVLTGGDTSAHSCLLDNLTAEKATVFLTSISATVAKIGSRLSNCRGNKNFEAWLYLLPLADPQNTRVVSLPTYRDKLAQLMATVTGDMEAIIANIDRFIAAKMESANPPSKKSPRKQTTKPTKQKP